MVQTNNRSNNHTHITAEENFDRKYRPEDLDNLSLDELSDISWRSLFKNLNKDESDAMYLKIRELSRLHLSNLPFNLLVEAISRKVHIIYDLEFARRITLNSTREVNHFFTPFSVPFLDNIATTIAHEHGYMDLLGWYNDFVAPPYIDKTPTFGKVCAYRGEHFAHLYSWMLVITRNKAYEDFTKRKKGDLILGKSNSHDFELPFLKRQGYEEDEFFTSNEPEIGWELLTGFISEEPVENPEEHEKKLNKVIYSFELLNEQDKKVLEHLIFDQMSNIDVFELMKEYVKPKPGTMPIEKWNNKKKSDTISLWRNRAITHLEAIYKDPRNTK